MREDVYYELYLTVDGRVDTDLCASNEDLCKIRVCVYGLIDL